jgi:hypothetical protein
LGTETAIRNGAPKLSWFNRGGEATPSTCLSRAMHAKSESNRSSSELSKPKKASSFFLLREKRNLNYWRARRREGGREKAEAKIRAGSWRWREFGHIRKASVAHPLIICRLDSFTEFILRGESPILLPPAPGRPGAHKSRPLDRRLPPPWWSGATHPSLSLTLSSPVPAVVVRACYSSSIVSPVRVSARQRLFLGFLGVVINLLLFLGRGKCCRGCHTFLPLFWGGIVMRS